MDISTTQEQLENIQIMVVVLTLFGIVFVPLVITSIQFPDASFQDMLTTHLLSILTYAALGGVGLSLLGKLITMYGRRRMDKGVVLSSDYLTFRKGAKEEQIPLHVIDMISVEFTGPHPAQDRSSTWW